MNRRELLLGLAATAAWGKDAAAANTLTPAEKKAGWQLLFDGKSYAHWLEPGRRQPAGDSWTIEDGCLKARPHPQITEDLFTKESFRDFEFAFDWKVAPGANSGVKYRIQDTFFLDHNKMNKALPRFEDQVAYELKNKLSSRATLGQSTGQEYVIGLEYQVIDNAVNKDARRGGLYQSGGLYSIIAPSQEAMKPAGEWNTGRIVVRGDHAEHWLNGVKVVDTSLSAPVIAEAARKRWDVVPWIRDLLTNQPKKETPISLQNHGDDAWFRSLKIRRLA